MLTYQILHEDNVVIIEPMGPLSAEDFQDLSTAVDAHLEVTGKLKGILIHARSFPGWEDFSGFESHLRFVREHHREVEKIALASDSILADIAPKLAGLFVSAELKGFAFDQKEAALEWLRASEK